MPTARKTVEEVKLHYHCANKRRYNDDHDYVRTVKPVFRGDGANNEVRQIRLLRCSFCNGKFIEGDARTLGRKK